MTSSLKYILCQSFLIFLFGLNNEIKGQYRKEPDKEKNNKKNELSKKSFTDRLFYSGGVGLSFGNNKSFIEVSPKVGYRVTKRLSVGTGITYQRFSNKNLNLKFKIFGGNLFAQYEVYGPLFFHTEFQRINFKEELQGVQINDENVNLFYVGGGYRQSIGGTAYVTFMLLYDIIDDSDLETTNPITRISFGFGF